MIQNFKKIHLNIGTIRPWMIYPCLDLRSYNNKFRCPKSSESQLNKQRNYSDLHLLILLLVLKTRMSSEPSFIRPAKFYC